MKEIIVYSKKFGVVKSKVDDSDYDLFSKYNWNISKDKGNLYLSARSVYVDNRLLKVKLHQLIMMPYDSKKYVIDHKDRDTLNNQKSNLRLATNKQNCYNRRPQSNKKSKYKGVTFYYNKWTATITKDYKKIHGGSFENEIDAAKKYNEMAIEYHGEFAYQNPI